MRVLRAFFIFMIILALSPSMAHGDSIAAKKVVSGRTVLDTVWIDLSNSKVMITLQVPGGFPLKNDRFQDFVTFSHPDAAITGTYFNMTTHVPVGTMVMFGQLIHYGEVGTAMAITGDNRVSFRRVPGGSIADWSSYETVIAAGPTILRAGRIDIQPQSERFTDRRIFGRAKRCAIGWRPDNTLIFASSRGTPTLQELAEAFKSVGCQEAMNLDGGTSSGLYHGGTYFSTPRRDLTNIILAFKDPSRYLSYRKSIAYTFYRTGKQFQVKGKNYQAMLNFRGAAAADPTNAGYFKDLATTYSMLGWPIWTSWALSKVAAIYDRKGFSEKSFHFYEKSLGISLQNPEAHRWMATYYEKRQETQKSAMEKKALLACLFTTCALKEDLYNTHERELDRYSFSWSRDEKGWLEDRNFGLKLKLPPGWEMIREKPLYAIFQENNPSSQRFISIEAIKSESFVEIARIVREIGRKRGGIADADEEQKIAGLPAYKNSDREIILEGKPWAFASAYIKQDRWVFALTCGAQQQDLPAAQSLLSDILATLSLGNRP
jgi:hypothetical protein